MAIASWNIVLATGVTAFKLLPRSVDAAGAELVDQLAEAEVVTTTEPERPETAPRRSNPTVFQIRAARIVLAAAVTVSGLGLSVLSFPKTFGGFTAKSTNPNNQTQAGTLKMADTVTGAIVTFSNAKPGDTAVGNVTVTNSGTLPASNMTLTVGTASNSPCPANTCPSGSGSATGSSGLSSLATISVLDTSQSGTPTILSTTIDTAVAHGAYTLAGTGGTSTWAPGESHSLSITLSMPITASDAYQGTSTNFMISFAGAS